jgi:hypothetical protein
LNPVAVTLICFDVRGFAYRFDNSLRNRGLRRICDSAGHGGGIELRRKLSVEDNNESQKERKDERRTDRPRLNHHHLPPSSCLRAGVLAMKISDLLTLDEKKLTRRFAVDTRNNRL